MSVKRFALSKEDCRRKIIVEEIGGVLETTGQSQYVDSCCDTCCPSFFERLNILKLTSVSHKCRRAVRVVDKNSLRTQLITAAFKQKADFSMIGVNFFCADSVIDEVCAQAKFVKT